MPVFLNWIGIFVIALGAFMIVPVLRTAEGFNPLLILGAPIAMNGIWLVLLGLLFFGLAKVVELLEKIAGVKKGK